MKNIDASGGRKLEDDARTGVTALIGRPVEVAVGRLDETGDWVATIGRAGERVERGETSRQSQLEDRARVRRAARRRRAVEVPVGPLDQPCVRIRTVRSAGEGVE